MSVLPAPIVTYSRLGRTWEIASDLLIATAVIWVLPLLLAAVAAVVMLVVG